MENKYQEENQYELLTSKITHQQALDILYERSWCDPSLCDDGDCYKCGQEIERNNCRKTLQEIIDDYEELLEKFTRQGEAYGNCCLERKKLEDALDMACEELAKSNTQRLVLYGGKKEDYKNRFLEK